MYIIFRTTCTPTDACLSIFFFTGASPSLERLHAWPEHWLREENGSATDKQIIPRLGIWRLMPCTVVVMSTISRPSSVQCINCNQPPCMCYYLPLCEVSGSFLCAWCWFVSLDKSSVEEGAQPLTNVLANKGHPGRSKCPANRRYSWFKRKHIGKLLSATPFSLDPQSGKQ